MSAGATTLVAVGFIQRLDGFYSEEHRIRVRTTEYPVESGADLTDHVVREPYHLKLKGAATVYQHGASAGLNAWNEILVYIAERRPIAVVTRLGTYHNMIIVDVKTGVTADTGDSLDFEMELKEILRASVTRTAIPSGGTPTEGPAVDRTSTTSRGRIQSGNIPPDQVLANLAIVS